MTNKEFKEMIAITKRLSELIKKYEANFAEDSEIQPIEVPEDVYDEICDLLNDSYVSLFGIS
tara:strand:- start:757 stop:942 length:186 start_codon:yes stop_codon:yes gene_type:complete